MVENLKGGWKSMPVINIVVLSVGFFCLIAAWIVIGVRIFLTRRDARRGEANAAGFQPELWLGESSGFPELKDNAGEVQEIRSLGATLAYLTGDLADFVRERVLNGGLHLTAVLIDPEAASNDAPLRRQVAAYKPETAEDDVVEALNASMTYFRRLKDDLARAGNSAGRVEVWGMQTAPTLGVTMLNPNGKDARMRVALYTYKYPGFKHPLLVFGRNPTSAEAYELFKAHYDRIKEESTLLLSSN